MPLRCVVTTMVLKTTAVEEVVATRGRADTHPALCLPCLIVVEVSTWSVDFCRAFQGHVLCFENYLCLRRASTKHFWKQFARAKL